jgi:hypothetical protein
MPESMFPDLPEWSTLEDNQGVHTYPVFARDIQGTEGAVHRFMHFPTTADLRKIALFGMSRLVDKTQLEEVDESFLDMYLASAIVSIEQQMGMDITPQTCTESFDWTEGILSSNYSPLKLTRWPATLILSMKLKFPHTQNTSARYEWEVPPNWLMLRGNLMQICADFGALKLRVNQKGLGAIMYGFGFAQNLGNYRPNAIEVIYQAGFPEDKFPATLFDLIITTATINVLTDIGPMWFPYNSTSVTIDNVTQSTSLPGSQFLLNRIQQLQAKQKTLIRAIQGAHGNIIKFGVLGG